MSIRAAYGEDDERIPVHIYLPKNASPPYQTVIYMPGSDATTVSDSSHMQTRANSGQIYLIRNRSVPDLDCESDE